MATVGQQLASPESGWKRYDDTHPFIGYFGRWNKDTTTTQNYNKTIIHVDYGDTEAKARIIFKGSKIRIIGNIFTNKPNNIDISIDGILETFSQYSTTAGYQVLNYEKVLLENKIHIVEISSPSDMMSDNSWNIDAIDIDADGELIRHDYVDNLPYDEPIRKYGVAWFGFDEASGNVTDKLGGSYIGTVTGATRVEGWNGEGYAMNFNGVNNFISTNLKPPVDEFSIRLKIKLNGYNSSIFSTQGWNATGYGAEIYIRESTDTVNYGKIIFRISNATANVAGAYSTKRLELNKWLDVLLTYDSTNGYVKGYLNDELILIEKTNGKLSNHTNNLVIGKIVGSTSYFNGQIDSYELYSKALTPSDFTQKRVAIKTTDNKNLVLPSKVGRVKEIPTSDEIDLINQGYNWREIDDAVDAQPIDLTQTTTEYEKVGKANVSLGNGKMFTIPLDDFKTISIEDNY